MKGNATTHLRLAMISVLVLAAMLWAVPAQADDLAKAECREIKRHAPCILQWEFSESRDASYRIQRWERSSSEWTDLDGNERYAARGFLSEPLAPGRLYRVLACSTKADACVSSNAVWAPVWDSVEKIPDAVQLELLGQVHDMGVTKTDVHGTPHPWPNVVTQYNMYLVAKEAAGFFNSAAEMPPIASPIMQGEAPDSVEEMIAFNVHQDYEQMRFDVLSLRRSPAQSPVGTRKPAAH